MDLAVIGDANLEKVFDTVEIENNYKVAQLDGKDCVFLCANNSLQNNMEILKQIGINKVLEVTKNNIDDNRNVLFREEKIEYTGFSVKGVGKYIKPIIRAALSATKDEKATLLTNRESEVLNLLAEGLTNKEIAKKLYISEKTVKIHLGKIFKKIDVSDRTNAALYALKINGR